MYGDDAEYEEWLRNRAWKRLGPTEAIIMALMAFIAGFILAMAIFK